MNRQTMQERLVEWTIQSQKTYSDPFNDVEVDVVFSKDGQSWRIPTFWRGGQQWTVRFAPPFPGTYTYRYQSTDADNSDLNGHGGEVLIAPYSGNNSLLKRGALRVSANRRYFEHADGTPFYWLGDTWWAGLSDRLSWEGFQTLVADRKAKGFTLVQIVAGLVPPEELAPLDPGYHNEGGHVWDPQFTRINPHYFDSADRRIQYLVDHELTPALVGGWRQVLPQIGVIKMQQHWRYIIARYGAYPVLWIVGGELIDPPEETAARSPDAWRSMTARGWTEVAKYIHATDPYQHPVTAHEFTPPFDSPLQDETLMDFDLFQSSHWGWASIATEVAQMNMHYARTSMTKPIVQGEIGYEKLGEIHLEDFQRTAFWLSMLNGAAGHTYGANGVFETYTGDKPLHRIRHSFMSWEEGMNLPGSYQLGLGARLLRQYPWWRFAPHPEWLSLGGTTLLESRQTINDFDIGRGLLRADANDPNSAKEALETNYPGGEWQAKSGNFRLPYAAGIPGEVRFIYIPTQLSFLPALAPTVLGLELGVRYHAYLWEPTRGTRLDLGAVERPASGARLFNDRLTKDHSSAWVTQGDLVTVKDVNETNAAATVAARSNAQAGLVLRYRDANNYVAAIYSSEEKSLYLLERKEGSDGRLVGKTPVSAIGAHIRLSAEVRENKGVASVTDGERTYTTPIVDLNSTAPGSAGLLHEGPGATQSFDHFELRRSPALVRDESRRRQLYDARGEHRGDLVGAGMTIDSDRVPGWDSFGRDQHILLDAYRPERLPTSGDWVLVLDATQNQPGSRSRSR